MNPLSKLIAKKNTAAPITFVAQASASFTAYQSGCTTSAINTTTANLLVAVVSVYQNFPTFSDNQGNTWTQLTTYSTGQYREKIYYCLNPTVSASHTFSIGTGVTSYASMSVLAFKNVTAYQQQSGNTGTSPLSSTPFVPLNNGSLIICGLSTDHATVISASSPFTYYTIGYVGGQHISHGAAYYIQPVAASVSCTWTWNSATAGTAAVAVFN